MSLWVSRFDWCDLDNLLVSGRSPKISKTDRMLMCWWAFTGLTHIILEGYFAFSPEFYKTKSPFYLAEVCKFSPVYNHCYKYRSQQCLWKSLYFLFQNLRFSWQSFGMILPKFKVILKIKRKSMDIYREMLL